jgi:hypothetical protein
MKTGARPVALDLQIVGFVSNWLSAREMLTYSEPSGVRGTKVSAR